MDDDREMTATTRRTDADAAESAEDRPYLYRHAGIREREGAIPLWLKLVCVSLLAWSLYYLVRYWTPE
jgi:hypothetical protein